MRIGPEGQFFTRSMNVHSLSKAKYEYIDLPGDRYRLDGGLNREIDRLPEKEKGAIRSTFVAGENPADLRRSLLKLTKLVYQELDGQSVPVYSEMIDGGALYAIPPSLYQR